MWDQSQFLIPMPGIGQSIRGGSGKCSSLPVCHYSLLGLATACRGSFPSCCGENHPDPKSGQDLDPEKLGCTPSRRGDVNDAFLHAFFLDFCPQIQTFATDPRVAELVKGQFQWNTPINISLIQII